ncbi:hypothetical protein D3C85_1193110 [compost metagenome]
MQSPRQVLNHLKHQTSPAACLNAVCLGDELIHERFDHHRGAVEITWNSAVNEHERHLHLVNELLIDDCFLHQGWIREPAFKPFRNPAALHRKIILIPEPALVRTIVKHGPRV